jgi:putative inorganic carbon (hco3(-)) transporter
LNSIANKIKAVNSCGNEIWMICIIVTAIITGIAIAAGKWLILGILLVPLMLYFCVHKPFIFPFGLYVVLLTLDPILTISGRSEGPTLTKYLGILTILVLFIKGIFEQKLKRPHAATLYWLLFLLLNILSILWAIEPAYGISTMPTAVGLFILYFVTSSYILHKNEFEILKVCMFIGGLLVSIYTIYTFISGNVDYGTRATLSFGNQIADENRLALSLIFPFSLCTQMIIDNKRIFMRGLLVIAIGLISFGIIITGSRGATIGLGMVLIIYFLLIKNKISFGILLVVLGIALISFIPVFFIERWGEIAETGGAGRLAIWHVGLKSLEKYWLFGAGLNNFTSAFKEFFNFSDSTLNKSFRASHNIYLGTFVECGIIGISLFVIAIVQHYRAINLRFARNNTDNIMLKATFAGILTHSFFIDSVWTKTFWFLWMMIMMHKNAVGLKKV